MQQANRDWRVEWYAKGEDTPFQMNYPNKPGSSGLLDCRDCIKQYSTDEEFMQGVVQARIIHYNRNVREHILVEIFPFNPAP